MQLGAFVACLLVPSLDVSLFRRAVWSRVSTSCKLLQGSSKKNQNTISMQPASNANTVKEFKEQALFNKLSAFMCLTCLVLNKILFQRPCHQTIGQWPSGLPFPVSGFQTTCSVCQQAQTSATRWGSGTQKRFKILVTWTRIRQKNVYTKI